jgi:23S rRNA (adenine2503-C2)-methyltransferase
LFHRVHLQRARRTIPNISLYLSAFAPEIKIANIERAIIQKMASPSPKSPSARPQNLLGKSPQELRAFLETLGEPAYRGAQIYHALYAERRFAFARMTNLPAKLRELLAREAAIELPRIIRKHCSDDGTIRYVLALGAVADDLGAQDSGAQDSPVKDSEKTARSLRPATIETVFMPEENRQTICISTQAGCAVDCHFCLTATLGLIRNLTAGEIIGQVLVALEENRDALKPQTNVVLMGQGEPLLNFDPVMAALGIMLDPNAMAISPKHVTLSTSGIVPGIERLALERVRPKLAISLNASSDKQRDEIMPINRKYPIEALLEACRRYPLRPWEHLTFEYVLLGGFNDSPDDARRVVKLLANLRAKVNLIPWNPGDLPYAKPDPERIEAFRKILADKDVRAFVRYSRGQDVMAACGQLALMEMGGSAPKLAQISPR